MAADPSSGGGAVLAVDLGGTWLRVTTVARGTAGAVREPVDAALEPAELGVALHLAAGALGGDAAGLVIGVPTFATADGVLLDCPALPKLTGASLPEVVGAAWADAGERAPWVRVVPDIAAAAVGEAVGGVGRGVSRLLCVAIGTGINAALVVDGRVVDVAHGCLGDAGHVVVALDGPDCTCGGRGCLEAVCSGWALGRDAAALGLADARALVEAARAGDPRAAAVVSHAGTALGAAMASWSVLTWPDVIAVAGGVAGAGPLLLDPARAALIRHAPPYVADSIDVVAATLGAEATLAGCLALSGTGHPPP